MLTSVRSLMAATVLAGAALATPAMAQDEGSSPISVSGNVALVTDYRFRGVGLSDGDPAIQGGITISTEPGFYVGAWGSSLGYTPAYGETELDFSAGYATEVSGVGIDVGGTYYTYPSNDVGPSDVFEIYGKVSPSVGPLGLTFAAYYMPKQDSLGGDDNLYLSADASVGIPNTPVTLTGHIAYTDGGLAAFNSDSKAWDYSVGASITAFGGLTVGVAYIGVEDEGANINGVTDDTVVGTLSFSF